MQPAITNTLNPSDRRSRLRPCLSPSHHSPTDTTPPTALLYLPPNHSRTALSWPTTEVSTLSNGLRVASQETYGQVRTFGIVSGCGRLMKNACAETETDTSTAGTNYLTICCLVGLRN